MRQSLSKYNYLLIIIFFAAMPNILYAADTQKRQDSTQSPNPAATEDTTDSHVNRIDFGNTYIIGQTIKSGAVYLLQRKKSEIKSMLKYREDYRGEILDGFSVGVSDALRTDQKPNQPDKNDRQISDPKISQE